MKKILTILFPFYLAVVLSSCDNTLTEPFAESEVMTEIVATETDIKSETTIIVATETDIKSEVTTIVTTEPVVTKTSFSGNDYSLDWQNAYANYFDNGLSDFFGEPMAFDDIDFSLH